MKFVTRAGETSEAHAFETVVGREMSKAHLNALRSSEALRLH
jgi:hypothetical protein